MNFTAKCYDELSGYVQTKSILGIKKLLRASQKFILPDGGQFFDMTYRNGVEDLFRLPYPACALEYRIPDGWRSVNEEPSQTEVSRNRIALCAENTDDPYNLGEGVIVIALYEIKDGWQVGRYAGFIQRAKAGGFIGKKQMEIPTIDLFPHLPSDETRMADMADEVNAAMQFMIAVNCDNVTKERIDPSAALNKKRAKNNKTPYDSYWLLNIAKEIIASTACGGSHDSPRLHYRRGHIRRLPTGAVTWVRHCMVGNPDAGVVEKDYAMTAAK